MLALRISSHDSPRLQDCYIVIAWTKRLYCGVVLPTVCPLSGAGKGATCCPPPSARTAVPAITQAARDMCCNSHKDFGLTFADSSSGFRKRWVRVKCTLVGSSFAEYAEEQEQGEPENYETQAQNRRESTAKAK